jgi:UDP-4-amino-4,6-dideoxy-N-acetyl-beta-L-altrosamine transaminase
MTAPPSRFLPYGRQAIGEDDIAAVVDVLRSDFLTTGPVTDKLEKAFRDFIGVRYAVACSSGTAALHMAACALDLDFGDAVIVPTITFLATANAARYLGANIVFADVDSDTGLITEQTFDEALMRARQSGKSVKAVFPVHLNGQAVNMNWMSNRARELDIAVVEDACHVLGGEYADSSAIGNCSHSDMTIFSFHPVKLIAMGEGGIVTTNDAKLDQQLRRIRNHGMVRETDQFVQHELGFDSQGEPNPWYYEMPELGFNYRTSDIHAALGLSQLSKLPLFVSRRRELADRYYERLLALSPNIKPLGRVPDGMPAWHLAVALIDFEAFEIDRAELMRTLKRRGIGSQVHYIPVHLQPYYRRYDSDLKLDGAESYYNRCLSLPLFTSMSRADVDHVVDNLADALGM